MAAGLGFKTFTTGEVLTAADTNGYLMQGVLVFATAAARDAAITSPQEGQFAFTKDTNGLWYYDGAAWVASGATGDIEGVTAGTGISGGGTSGTVTVTNSMATAITTNGDVIYGTGSGTFTRLGIGSSAQVLTVASGVPSWATPAASASGLTLITTQTYSASGSAAISNCFSTTYDSYMVVFNNLVSSTSSTLDIFLRTGATNVTTNYRTYLIYMLSAGATVNGAYSTTSTFDVSLSATATNASGGFMTLENPFTATPTNIQGSIFCGTAAKWLLGSANNSNATSYESLGIVISTGTFSGSISIYGMAK